MADAGPDHRQAVLGKAQEVTAIGEQGQQGQHNQHVLALIERLATDPDADVEKLERVMALWERTQATIARREYAIAMNLAQKEIEPVARTAKSEHHWYAKLEHVDAAIRPIYISHGFSLSDNTVQPLQAGNIRLECLCSHVGGHFERFFREGPPDNLGPQGKPSKTLIHGIGSTETFLRRYLHCGIFNVVFERMDNDGASGPISADDVATLLEKLHAGKVNHGRFLRYMQLPATTGEILAMIPKADLGKALLAAEELVRQAANADPA